MKPLPAYLDQYQQNFCHYEGDARLLAPAGSGKTLSLLFHCVATVRKATKEPKFLIVAFTRAACDELKARIAQDKAYAPIRDRTEIVTLNAWGYRRLKRSTTGLKLLSKKSDRYYYVRNQLRPLWEGAHSGLAKLLDTNRQSNHEAVFNLIDDLASAGFDHVEHQTPEQFIGHYEWLKENGLSGQVAIFMEKMAELKLIDVEMMAKPSAGELLFKRFGRFWQMVQQHMWETRSISFEGQKYWAYRMLAEQTRTQSQYTHVLVDEFQDINTLDLKLLKKIVHQNNAALTLAGDDDQAIFEWRGASPNFILKPEHYLDRDIKTFILERNYRSPANIVEHSQKLIRHNTNRVKKDVKPASTAKAEINVRDFERVSNATEHVTQQIEEILASKAGTIALIGRKRSQIIPYQIILASKQIEFCAAEDLQIFLSDTFKKLIDLVETRASLGRRQRTGAVVEQFLALCNYVKRYPVKRDELKALSYHLTEGKPRSIHDCLDRLYIYDGPLKGENATGDMSRQFHDAINHVFSAETVASFLMRLSGEFAGLGKDYGKSLEDIFYADPPFLFLSDYASRYGDDFETFIDDIEEAKDTLVTLPEDDQSTTVWKRQVHLMTALRAKGKEFDNVFLLDVNEDIWPIRHADTVEKLEQERRIFYVAATRAKQRLEFLYSRTLVGKQVAPSQYLDQMELDY